jgi:hypothetical protein
VNDNFFSKMFMAKTVPHFTTLIYFLKVTTQLFFYKKDKKEY